MEPINLSSSSISTFAKCQRLFWFDKLSDFAKREFSSDAMDRGTLFHAGIAVALKQTDPKRNYQVALEAVMKLYQEGTGSVDEVDDALEMLRYYLDDLGINTRNFAYKLNGVPMIEWEFDVDFHEFRLRGTIDAVIKDVNGKVYLVDWKTRQSFYADDVVELDKQIYIYAAILKLEGVDLDGAMQIQLSKPPQPPKFKAESDTNLASSLNERSAKTTQEMFDKTVAHMTPDERFKAAVKLSNKIVPMTEFKRISPINLNDVEPVFTNVLGWGHRIANEQDYLPVLDSWVCKTCQWRTECRMELKGI